MMNDKPYSSKELEEIVNILTDKPYLCKKLEELVNMSSKPWSVAEFESKREHLTNFVRNTICPLIEKKVMRILIRAPVKSGKREIVEYIAMRDLNTREKRVHAFISAWHRTADREQREELETQNLTVFSITNDANVKEFLKWLQDSMDTGYDIVIHLDECDHGSGDTQKLSEVWTKIRKDMRITAILYSATPEEAMFSGDFDVADFIGNHPPVFYTPPEGYCGPNKFLEEDLVHEARPFFTKNFELSEQGKEIISDMRESMRKNPLRNIFILRLTYSLKIGANKTENKAKHLFLNHLSSFKELSDFTVIVDKGYYANTRREEIEWSSKSYWDEKGAEPILIVHDQTSTRSTEWSCHDRVFATHDFRESVTYAVVSQAQERVNHYSQKYNGFQPIRVYGHKKSFLLSAGLICHEEYLTNHWFMRKVDKRVATGAYTIKNTVTNAIHPDYDKYYSEEKAVEILKSLHSYGVVNLSSRIAADCRLVPVYDGEWIPMTKESWNKNWPEYCSEQSDKALIKKKNPFIQAEKHRVGKIWLGQHRGWKHLRYENNKLYEIVSGVRGKSLDLGSTGGTRVKVCYHKGELGVFVAHISGSKTLKPIQAINSMYERESDCDESDCEDETDCENDDISL